MTRVRRGPLQARPSGEEAVSEPFEGAGQRLAAAPGREVETDAGGPVIVCPGCWPDVEARMRGGSGVEVRVLGERPEWARCAVCDPEQVC